MDFKKYGNATLFDIFKNVNNIWWGDVVVHKENPEKLKQKYKASNQTDYVINKLKALKYLGYSYAKLLENGRVQVYGLKVEPRYVDFLDLDEEGKEYKIKDIINA